MKLLVIRHGPAGDREAWATEGRDDRLRPLTPDGKKEMRQVAKGLRTLIPGIDLIATSPLVRAAQTAEIVAKQYATESVALEALAPGHDSSRARRAPTILCPANRGSTFCIGCASSARRR